MLQYFKSFIWILVILTTFYFFTFKTQVLDRINLFGRYEETTKTKELEYEHITVTDDSKFTNLSSKNETNKLNNSELETSKPVKKLPECILIGAAKSGEYI
jgi:hypothetical protein